MLLVVEYFDDPVDFADASDVMKRITVPSSQRHHNFLEPVIGGSNLPAPSSRGANS